MDAFGDIHSSRALVLITDLFLSFVFNYRNVLIIKNVCCVSCLTLQPHGL